MPRSKWQRDGVGSTVPDYLKDVFHGNRWRYIKNWEMRLQKIMGDLDHFKNQAAYELIDTVKLQEAVIATVESYLQKKKPYAVCPLCPDKQDVGCICNGRRWLTKEEYAKDEANFGRRPSNRKRGHANSGNSVESDPQNGVHPGSENQPEIQPTDQSGNTYVADPGSDVLRPTSVGRTDPHTTGATQETTGMPSSMDGV